MRLLARLSLLSLLIGLAVHGAPTQAAPEPDTSMVLLSVVVERDGSISNATVARSSGDAATDWAALDHARQLHLAPGATRSQRVIAIRVHPQTPAANAPRLALPTFYDI